MARKAAAARKERTTRDDRIAEHETLTLSERDRAAFFAAMIDPPKPSARLARALAEHSRRVGE